MRNKFIQLLLLVSIVIGHRAALGDDRDALSIHMISGSKEYKSEESLKLLQQHLEDNFDVFISASWVKDGATDLPNVEQIAKADLLIVFARRLKLPEDQMAVIRKHWESGKPVVGIRTASHAFSNQDNEVFDRKVMGGNYTGHLGGEAVTVTAASDDAAKHVVLKDVGPIESTKIYKAGALADDAILLQNGTVETKKTTYPVTWLHQYQGGRVFYTSLGTPDDFTDDDFIRLLVNAIYWTTGKSDTP